MFLPDVGTVLVWERENADVFAQLAQNLSYKKVVRSSESLFRVEALLLGYAGLSADVPETDEYALGLRGGVRVSGSQIPTGSHECFSMEIHADSSDSFSLGFRPAFARLFDDAFQFLAFQRAGCLKRVGNLWFAGRNRLFLLGYSR